ncbi:hypothetical protein Asp14428_58030 [Actinoplanes sp. NBRC 14428]|uniref:Uncharacterized protein (DUF1501 family) n=1 Tax=Pseudosporangium ferrugineum TaxID=439699 RepID=A0A2T0SDN4_9ACTN|nr:DUF1501 domain-containing protein [Pseudosporangium ferrugineum]PRY31528.1 uncharacterized protein (DUF1501 family) [Pseudosporangium ferrugineum]BCJ54328.1 hypothetical protein Asp14428_58030 [Actinoplanes sp. NBRC 14428]
MEANENCGCTISRRTLLAGGAAGVLAGLAGDLLSTQLAFASPGYRGDVFVLLSLRGGFDGLSAVVPHGDPAYYAARPGIAVPKARLIGGDATFGLNPALAPLLPYWRNGSLAAVQAVGQPAPNRSHFSAMEELERAAPGTSVRTGWLDRMMGGLGGGGVFGAVSMGSAMPARVLAGPAADLGLTSVDRFVLSGENEKRPMAGTMAALYANAPAALSRTAAMATSALATTATLKAAGYTPANGAAYPDTELGRALSDVARLVKSDVGLMSACVDSGDWDMHENLGTAVPGKRMYEHLADLAAALAAFAADLGPAGLGRVTLVTLSEFGRRVGQNGSGGLDHGYGNAMFVLGGGVKGGKVYGRWPGLAKGKLVDGDLAVTTDYRAVIGEILRARCGVSDVAGVFPGVRPAALGLVRSR